MLILCMCVSVGTVKSHGRITFHPPGSTSSLRTIHFRNKNNLLHALPSLGAVTSGKLPASLLRDNRAENSSSAEYISPAESLRHSRKNSSSVPCSRRISRTLRRRLFMSLLVVNLCLKPSGTISGSSLFTRNLYGSSVKHVSTRSTLFMICATLPYANDDAISPAISRSLTSSYLYRKYSGSGLISSRR